MYRDDTNFILGLIMDLVRGDTEGFTVLSAYRNWPMPCLRAIQASWGHATAFHWPFKKVRLSQYLRHQMPETMHICIEQKYQQWIPLSSPFENSKTYFFFQTIGIFNKTLCWHTEFLCRTSKEVKYTNSTSTICTCTVQILQCFKHVFFSSSNSYVRHSSWSFVSSYGPYYNQT